jgi:hypothetical protein
MNTKHYFSFLRKTVTTALVVILLLAVVVNTAFAAVTANLYPAAWASTTWTNGNNGRLSDNARATSSANGNTITFSNFGFAIPAGNTIAGIEVNIEGYTTGRNVTVSISPDGGTTWAPTTFTTSTLGGGPADGNQVLGGTANNWGRTWTLAEVNSTNFMVRLVTGGGGGTFSLDSVYVRITYFTATTTSIASDLPDPSIVGQSVVVTYTVFPAGATGNVTVSDGVNSCTDTVAAGACTLALTTVGARTLTATYAGDATYAGSV